MGLKKRQFVYVSDRGQEFEIDEMQSSHLLNAINHHHTQFHTVEMIKARLDPETKLQLGANLDERLGELGNTISELMMELANRSMEDDAKRDDGGYTRGNSDHRY